MSNLTIFKFEDNQVRIELKNNEPWFCVIDLCRIFAIQNAAGLLAKKECLEQEGIEKISTLTTMGKQLLWYVNEPNLYSIIFRSNKPEAKRFQKWVFEEVLPQIRKTGSYGQQNLAIPEPQKYPRWVTGWEIDGLHDLIHETVAEHLPHYGKDAENAIIMRIKYELNVSTFERETTITQDLFDKAYAIVCKIYNEAKKFADHAQRQEQCFIKDNIKGIAIKL